MLINDLARVLFVSYTADWTGPTNSLLLLLKYLRHRYEVAVLLPGQGLFSETLAHERIPFFSLPDLTKWSIPAMVRLIRRGRFQLIYGNTTGSGSRNAFIAAKLMGVPFICHVRAIATKISWLRYIHLNGYLNLADAVIPVSFACADSLQRRIRKSKLHVVHNGVELNDWRANPSTARGQLQHELGLSGQGPMLVYLGHLKSMKGQEYAVQAAAEVIRGGVDLNLLLVGHHNRDRDYVARVRAMIDKLGLRDKVSLTGFREDMLTLLSLADIYIHTSLDEAHPRAVLEAMAMGLPVVAFAVDGVAETVIEGQTGYLVSPGDVSGMTEAILKLVGKPSLRTQMGSAGKHRVKTHFSARVTAEKVARIIDSYGILSE